MLAATDDSDSAPRLAVINGLRGIAILAVLHFHLLSQYVTPTLEDAGRPVGPYLFSPYTLFANGWLGVNLFFVLSGFVLALPYALGQRRMQTASDVGSFYRRRARRLFPLYYLTLFVALLFETRFGADVGAFIDEAVSVATFAFAFQSAHFLVRFNVVLWSLGVEFWFSVAFPLLLVLFRRLGATTVTILSLVLAVGVRFHDVGHFTGQPVFLLPLKDGPLGRLDDFVVGMTLAYLYVRRPLTSRVLAPLSVAFGVALVVLGSAGWDNVLSGRLAFIASAWLNDVVLLGLSLVLLGLLGGVPTAVRALVTLAPLQLAGMMCYSLYLWHLLGMHPFDDPPLSPSYTAVRLSLTLLVSALTYRLVEFPTKGVRELFLGSRG